MLLLHNGIVKNKYVSLNTIKKMVITFGNQKGGVGKTTLCTLFANYLATMGKKTLVVDCDNQQTITEKRKADVKKYTDAKVKYNVQSFSISNVDHVQNLMYNLRKMNGVILIDAPGNLAQQGLIPLFALSDYVVCPFQYESTSVNSTVTFILFLQKLKENFKQMDTKVFFVVNKHDKRYGTQKELELWAKTDERLGQYGFVTPKVEVKADMQRYNTMEVMKNQLPVVKPAFDFICKQIFKEEGHEV